MESTHSNTSTSSSNHGDTFMVGNPSDALRYMQINDTIAEWVDKLFLHLSVHGISYQECNQIASSRLSNIFSQLTKREFDMSDAFPSIINKEHANNIFISYIRHRYTNYDTWCQLHNKDIGNLSKSQIHESWKNDCPSEHTKYQEKIDVLNHRIKRPRHRVHSDVQAQTSTQMETTISNSTTSIVETITESDNCSSAKTLNPIEVIQNSSTDNKELSAQDILREKLNEMMKTSVVLIKFTNRKFKEEIAKATNCQSEIPKRKIGGRKTPKNNNWITFYDKFHGMYRSITVTSVMEYKLYEKSSKLANMIKVDFTDESW